MICSSSKNHPTVKNLKNLEKSGGKFEQSIYGIKDCRQHAKKFYAIHYIFKYRIFIPVLMLIDKFFGKIKIKKIPKEDHNYLLLGFNRAYNKALRNWMKYYLYTGSINNKSKTYITRKFNVNRSVKMLKSMKDWMFTVILMDAAYKEFFNILMLETAKEMQKEFKGKDVNHLLYNAKIVNDVNYFSLFKEVQTRTNVGMHQQEECNTNPKEIRIEQRIKRGIKQ